MTEQTTLEQMQAELSPEDFAQYWKAYWNNHWEDKEFRAILQPLGLDTPGFVWLKGQQQFLYSQFRKAYDLGIARGYKHSTAEDVLKVVQRLENKLKEKQ